MVNRIKKYIPGQVWNIKASDSEKTIIILTEGESLMALRVTNKSRVTSSWHYDYDVDDESMSVVIDQPTFINSRGLGGTYGKYLYTMPDDMLAEIVSHYAAYIFYNSTGVAPDEGVIKNIMASHVDTVVVEAPKEPVIKRSTPTPKESEAPSEEEAHSQKIEQPKRATSDKALKSIEDLKSRLKYADPDDAPHMMAEIARLRESGNEHIVETEADEAEVITEVKPTEETTSLRHKRCGKKRQKKIMESITVDDLVLIGKGRTRTDDLKRDLKEFGINNPEFILDKMKKSGKLIYNNNMYNCIMKKDINSGVRNRFLNYYDQILADTDKFGQQVTAKIWGADPSTISLIVNKMG